MKTSESIQDLYKALITAQGQFHSADKNATNPHFRSHYADLTSIVKAARGPLMANGLGFVQMPFDREGHAYLMTRIIHTSGQFMESEVRIRTSKDDAQAFGSALSYFKRYALQAALGIVTEDEDDDGEAASQKPQAPIQNYAKPQAPVAQVSTTLPKAKADHIWVKAVVPKELGQIPKDAGFRWHNGIEKWVKELSKADLEKGGFKFEIEVVE